MVEYVDSPEGEFGLEYFESSMDILGCGSAESKGEGPEVGLCMPR